MLSVLTGRNHTTVGMACIAEATTGFPGSNGHIPFETATIAEVLGERDVKLKYVYDYLGMGAQTVVSDMTVPAGKHTLGVELTKEDATAQATIGTLNLYIDTKSVGELKNVQTQLGKFNLCGEGLNIGRDGGAPVTLDYPGDRPWIFTGGKILQVAIDVSGEPYVDFEKETIAIMKRD
jgi:arylsulfatase